MATRTGLLQIGDGLRGVYGFLPGKRPFARKQRFAAPQQVSHGLLCLFFRHRAAVIVPLQHFSPAASIVSATPYPPPAPLHPATVPGRGRTSASIASLAFPPFPKPAKAAHGQYICPGLGCHLPPLRRCRFAALFSQSAGDDVRRAPFTVQTPTGAALLPSGGGKPRPGTPAGWPTPPGAGPAGAGRRRLPPPLPDSSGTFAG